MMALNTHQIAADVFGIPWPRGVHIVLNNHRVFGVAGILSPSLMVAGNVDNKCGDDDC